MVSEATKQQANEALLATMQMFNQGYKQNDLAQQLFCNFDK